MINADIIFEHLSKKLNVRRFGARCSTLTLKRTAFLEANMSLSKDIAYLTDTSTLMKYDISQSGLTFICFEGMPPVRFTHSDNALLVLDHSGGLSGVFNAVQDVFSYYDTWSETLQRILDSSANFKEMIECSVPVFRNPLLVNDRDLTVLAYTVFRQRFEASNTEFYSMFGTQGSGEIVSDDFVVETADIPASAAAIKALKDTLQDTTNPTGSYCYTGINHYFVRLKRGTQNLGAITLADTVQPFRSYDLELLKYLAGYVGQALRMQRTIEGSSEASLRSLLKDLLLGYPVREHAIRTLLPANLKGPFICICLQPKESATFVPSFYIFENFKKIQQESISFEHESHGVSFFQVGEKQDRLSEILEKLKGFLDEIGFIVGVSNTFTNLMEANHYFRQARCAMLVGSSLDTEKSIYQFSQYALPYMLQNCLGEFQFKYICPPELLKLKYISTASSVDYWETLQAYLDNEMNIAKAAETLFLHRSTMFQRIEKIKNIMGLDLEDMNVCLYLHMCMRAAEFTS